MRRKHVAQQAQRDRNYSPTNGTGHRASTRMARVGVSALIAGQLMMPGISLAAEATDQDTTKANNAATATVEEATPAPAASSNAKNTTETQSTPIQTSKEPAAAPEAQSTPKANSSEPESAARESAVTSAAPTPNNQPEAAATAQTPATSAKSAMLANAIQTCGVTDATDNPGGITTMPTTSADCARHLGRSGKTINPRRCSPIQMPSACCYCVLSKTDGSSLPYPKATSVICHVLHMVRQVTCRNTYLFTCSNLLFKCGYGSRVAKEKKKVASTRSGT